MHIFVVSKQYLQYTIKKPTRLDSIQRVNPHSYFYYLLKSNSACFDKVVVEIRSSVKREKLTF